MQYRKEVDGLRAIAVLPVIFFHAGFSGFSGGYVGVDIFFVISGYLITTIILEEKNNNNFSIVNFYERRARRILPALTFVLIFTTIMAYVLMPANLLKSYSQSLFSVTTFSSNVFFYITSDYFSIVSDEKPLLHTWSLAVEEQYYLFFPVMVVLLWTLGKKRLLSIIVVIAFVSLLLSEFLASKNAVDANFYLIFSRAWELFSGSILAFLPLHQLKLSQRKRDFMGGTALTLIGGAIFFLDEQTPFPGFYALLPVLGACLIIIFVNQATYVGKFLSSKILVFIGLISYSLYLWHQPLFAFLRLKSVGEPSIDLFLWAILATLIFSFLSWKYIEKPFRNKIKFTRVTIFRYSAISIFFFSLIGLIGHFNQGFYQRFNVPDYAESIKYSPKRSECHTKEGNYIQPEDSCQYFSKDATWASFGDSHSVEIAYALAQRLDHYDTGVIHLSISGCAPALLFEVKSPPNCTKWMNESLNYLVKNNSIKNVLLAFRYSAFLFGDQLNSYPKIPNKDPRDLFSESFLNSTSEDLREIYWQSVKEIVNRLMESGKKVFIVYPIPELPMDIHEAVAPFSIFSNKTMMDDLEKATSAKYYFDRNKFIIEKLDSLPYSEYLQAIKPFDLICDKGFCAAVSNGKALYFDDDHLSIYGAKIIVDAIILKNKI